MSFLVQVTTHQTYHYVSKNHSRISWSRTVCPSFTQAQRTLYLAVSFFLERATHCSEHSFSFWSVPDSGFPYTTPFYINMVKNHVSFFFVITGLGKIPFLFPCLGLESVQLFTEIAFHTWQTVLEIRHDNTPKSLFIWL